MATDFSLRRIKKESAKISFLRGKKIKVLNLNTADFLTQAKKKSVGKCLF